jgi:PAS domain S-box-containing protein
MENLNSFDPSLALNSIYNGIVAIDTRAIITYFNKTAEKIFAIPAHEAINRYIMDVLPNTGGKLLESLNTGNPFYGEKLKGENVTLISNINPILANGKISGAVSVFQDISEIESISKELGLFKNMKNWLDAIIDSSYDGLLISDHEGKIIRFNKASEKMSGIKEEEVVGKNVRECIDRGLIDKSVTLEVFAKRASVTILQHIKGGKKILLTGNPIFNEKGEINFVVINSRDITELDNLRMQLQEAQALAKGYSSRLSELEMQGVDLSNIIFRSDEMQRIVKMTLRVSKVDSTVLLLGESGVGKGKIAKLIHTYSNRNTGPFIRVDCAGIPESLFESELFGYERGAFTGAKSEGKPGLLELANKGTLFLDEIGEIPLNSQSKLLRFLEDYEIIRIGGTETRRINVRVIAATNKNIEEMVASKIFREDLYYRLNVIPIYIPPLRERREDILPLIFHSLQKLNNTYQKKKVLSPETVEALCKYDFPGNIRELTNFIERLVVVAEKERIEVNDLPNTITGYMPQTLPHPFLSGGISLKDVLRKYEGLIIERTIKKYGSQQEAARMLKVDQATISRKMKKYSPLKINVIMHK